MWEKIEALTQNTDDRHKINEQVFFSSLYEYIPLKRPQTPEDIGHAVVFFASPQSKNITGQTLNVDGGAIMN